MEDIVGAGRKKLHSKPCEVGSAHKRKETCYICSFCKVALNKGTCFQRYDRLKDF
jgi:hypothetical protein